MEQVIVRRLAMMIPLLLGISIISYAIVRAAPGDPARMLTDPELLNDEQIAEARKQLGLDQSLPVQYARMMTSLATGDLRSFKTRQPVVSMIRDRLPTTLALTGTTILFGLITGILLGMLQAVKSHSWLDRIATFFGMVGFAVPNFWLALMLILVFSSRLKWLPASGIRPTNAAGWNVIEMAPYLLLPTFVLGTGLTASIARYTRSSMLEALNQDYVRTARAKGLREGVVIGRHALRNSLLPVITLLGVQIPFLLGGSVAIESIFALPGIGRMALDAVTARDYPVIIAVNLFVAVLVLVANLLADLAYAAADPRIRHS